MGRTLAAIALVLAIAAPLGSAAQAPAPEGQSGQLTFPDYDPWKRSAELDVEPAGGEEVDAGSGGTDTSEVDRSYAEFRLKQLDFKLLTILMLSVTAVVAHFLVLFYFRRISASSRDVVTATGLIYVIFGTIILTQMALDTQQMMAATGILGAVAGYLFGVSGSKGRAEKDESA